VAGMKKLNDHAELTKVSSKIDKIKLQYIYSKV